MRRAGGLFGCLVRAGALVPFLVWGPVRCLAGEVALEISSVPEDAVAFIFSGDTFLVKGDKVDGGFRFHDLSPGTYNVEIVSKGLDVIGVDMRPRDADGTPVAVVQAGQGVEAVVREIFAHTTDFFDKRRMPLVLGTEDRAVALVENVRYGDTTTSGESKQQVIFRLDLWDFRKVYGAWRKTGARTFLRRTIYRKEFEAARFIYSSELGGIDVGQNSTVSVEYDFPDMGPVLGEEKT